MRVSNLTVSTLLPLLAIASAARANEHSPSPEAELDSSDGGVDSQATTPITVATASVAIVPIPSSPSPEFTPLEASVEAVVAESVIESPTSKLTPLAAATESAIIEPALAGLVSEPTIPEADIEPTVASPPSESTHPEAIVEPTVEVTRPQPVHTIQPLPAVQTKAGALSAPETLQPQTIQAETIQSVIVPDFVNLTVTTTDSVVASEQSLHPPQPSSNITPTIPSHQPEFAEPAIVAAQPSNTEPDWIEFADAETDPIGAVQSHAGQPVTEQTTCQAKLHPKLLIGEPAAAIAQHPLTNPCYEPEAIEPVAAPKARKYMSSPALSIYIPVGYGADRNTAFVSTNYQSAVRPDASGSTFNGGLGVGLGNANKSVGVELSYALANNNAFGEGGFNVKVHRRLKNDWAVAGGWNGLLNIGRNDFEHSKYGVVTKVVRLSPSLDDPLSRLSITAGVGDNQFRSNGAAKVGDNNVNVFGNMALRVARPVSLIAEWTGQDVGLGLSIAPFKHVPLTITPAVRDLITTNGRSTRFVLGVGTAFRF
ncbi:MAG: hypothetical protein F6J87_10885 [Spirulina sp. SIO3F2]|nr:hypothetical protein [Spirulina sp. SIO3F2]